MRVDSIWRCCCEAWARRRTRDEAGAANVEYALLLVFIAVFCIASMTYFGLMLKDYLLDAGSKL